MKQIRVELEKVSERELVLLASAATEIEEVKKVVLC